MLTEFSYEQIKDKGVFIDVRSPSEYIDSTIAGAINIPILDDEERKIIGTTYKQVSKDEAKHLGVKFVSPKLPVFFETIMQLKNTGKTLVVFCARGGYRSTAFATIFNSIGLNIVKLKNGYKGYRNHLIEAMPRLNDEITYIVIHGNTGVGKTDILYNLREYGYDVLDLEGAANHRGSLLGSIGMGNNNSQKMFESNLLSQLERVKSKYIFVEAESSKIGKCLVPYYIFDKMKAGIHINVDASLEYRVKSLKKDYVTNESWAEDAIQALEQLRRFISNEGVDNLQNMLRNYNFEDVARELMINYYDPMYNHKANEYIYAEKFVAEVSSADTAKNIELWFKNNY